MKVCQEAEPGCAIPWKILFSYRVRGGTFLGGKMAQQLSKQKVKYM